MSWRKRCGREGRRELPKRLGDWRLAVGMARQVPLPQEELLPLLHKARLTREAEGGLQLDRGVTNRRPRFPSKAQRVAHQTASNEIAVPRGMCLRFQMSAQTAAVADANPR